MPLHIARQRAIHTRSSGWFDNVETKAVADIHADCGYHGLRMRFLHNVHLQR